MPHRPILYMLVLLTASFVIFHTTRCASNKPEAMTYEFPPAMKENVRADFLRQCKKGEVLYALNCAQCHNQKIKGKEVIPDFTTEQLLNYDMRLANPDHESKLGSTEVTTEELGYIISFLSYKKRSNVPALFEEHKK